MTKFLFIIAIPFSIMSCSIQELTPGNSDINKTVNISYNSKTKSLSCTDSLILKSAWQSDYRIMLYNHVIYKNGSYFITLTRKDAKEIGIPDEIYNSISSQINELNKI